MTIQINGVGVREMRVTSTEEPSVKVKWDMTEDGPEGPRTSYPLSWVETEARGEDYGRGERMDDDEFYSRREAAIDDTREQLEAAFYDE